MPAPASSLPAIPVSTPRYAASGAGAALATAPSIIRFATTGLAMLDARRGRVGHGRRASGAMGTGARMVTGASLQTPYCTQGPSGGLSFVQPKLRKH